MRSTLTLTNPSARLSSMRSGSCSNDCLRLMRFWTAGSKSWTPMLTRLKPSRASVRICWTLVTAGWISIEASMPGSQGSDPGWRRRAGRAGPGRGRWACRRPGAAGRPRAGRRAGRRRGRAPAPAPGGIARRATRSGSRACCSRSSSRASGRTGRGRRATPRALRPSRRSHGPRARRTSPPSDSPGGSSCSVGRGWRRSAPGGRDRSPWAPRSAPSGVRPPSQGVWCKRGARASSPGAGVLPRGPCGVSETECTVCAPAIGARGTSREIGRLQVFAPARRPGRRKGFRGRDAPATAGSPRPPVLLYRTMKTPGTLREPPNELTAVKNRDPFVGTPWHKHVAGRAGRWRPARARSLGRVPRRTCALRGWPEPPSPRSATRTRLRTFLNRDSRRVFAPTPRRSWCRLLLRVVNVRGAAPNSASSAVPPD